MKSEKKEEVPLLNIERSPLFLLGAVGVTAVLGVITYSLFKAINPWGFIVMIPSAVIAFQTLWWLLNPFASIYDDKVEIRQSLLHHKLRYFVDLKQINGVSKNKLVITYNDDEMEALNLFGIKPSHISLLRAEMEKFVSASIQVRP